MNYTVGELATLSGLTVRALHHYEKLGLLHPSGRTEAGYRQYGEADVSTLHRILAYQQMGIALKDIEPMLGADAPPLADVLTRQIALAQEQLLRQQHVLAMLQRVERRARDGGADLSDHLLKLMSLMRTYDRYFTPDEMQQLLALQGQMSDDDLLRIKADVAALIPELQAALDRGADPRAPDVAVLARRLLSLGAGFPEDDALRDKARAMLAQEPRVQRESGMTPALFDFIDQAVAAVREVSQ